MERGAGDNVIDIADSALTDKVGLTAGRGLTLLFDPASSPRIAIATATPDTIDLVIA